MGEGSLKEKCRANLAAIRLVRKLQSENRTPTNEEKSALVRYVGWGGLPQVFSPATDWQAENVELASLLSEDEFRAARATTLNAHYTAGAVVKGMYSALERLGHQAVLCQGDHGFLHTKRGLIDRSHPLCFVLRP